MKTGVYIHIPFCLRKCLYCDFVSFESKNFDEYFSALKKEIGLYKKILSECEIDSIFIGGGTPSAVPESFITDILKEFEPERGAEITIEVNPKTVDLKKLLAYREAGINRISIGMQSANDNELKALGRIHNNDDFLNTFEAVRKAGFDNINVDIMFGIPGQTVSSFERTLGQVLDLDPTHISAYSLIIEENTPFYDMELDLPSEDAEREMYAAVLNNGCGYERYEISNFCHKGYECRHNLKYWRFLPFLGFGLSAYSFFGGIRYNNHKNMSDYIKALDKGEKPVAFFERESKTELMKDYIITGMRLGEGINFESFGKEFDVDFIKAYGETLSKYTAEGLIIKTDEGIRFSDKGFEISNYILKDFI